MKVIVITGLSGAGKTTFAKILNNNLIEDYGQGSSMILATDDFFKSDIDSSLWNTPQGYDLIKYNEELEHIMCSVTYHENKKDHDIIESKRIMKEMEVYIGTGYDFKYRKSYIKPPIKLSGIKYLII